MKFFKYSILLFVLVGLGGLFYVSSYLSPLRTNKELIYEVQSGSLRSHLLLLEKQEIIKSAFFAEIYARFFQKTTVQKGEYQFNSNMTVSEILKILSSGKSIRRPITFKEGINIFEMAQIIEEKGLSKKEDFLKKVQDPKIINELLGESYPSLEGFLYPETYFYEKNMPIEILIRAQVRQFFNVVKEVAPEWMNDKSKLRKMVTLASLVEKETGAPQERPTIASVFYNRLKKGMKLQSDPTIIYGLAMETGLITRNIRRSDITKPTPYNTYTVKALPVAPIANPGKEALKAVKNPAQTEYLFFVSMNEGLHYFSKTYKEHRDAVQKYQVNPKAREGKSWRNLKNN